MRHKHWGNSRNWPWFRSLFFFLRITVAVCIRCLRSLHNSTYYILIYMDSNGKTGKDTKSDQKPFRIKLQQTPWSSVLPEKLTGPQLAKKFQVFHETRRFITALTKTHHLSLPWARSNQSMLPNATSWRTI